jgi:hypothetical protein
MQFWQVLLLPELFPLVKRTPPCRVMQSSEPAFAGWCPSRRIRLGSGLSRHLRKIGLPDISVGSERKSNNTCTVGQLSYTTKKVP